MLSRQLITLFAYAKTGSVLPGIPSALGLEDERVLVFPVMVPSFHTVDRQTYRRIVMAGLLFCMAFVAVSSFLRPQPAESRVIVKPDLPIRTAGAARSTD